MNASRPPKPFAILMVYLVIALAYTFPLILNLTTGIPGNNGDSIQNLWPFWYFPHALIHGLHPLYAPDFQLYPYGISLIYATNSAIGAVTMSPISLMVSPAAALNCWLLLHIWLGGWLFYNFCITLQIPVFGSFLGGVAYMCSPFMAAHLPGHYTLVQIGYTALALWGLAALLQRSSEGLSGRHLIGPAMALGCGVWSVAVSDFYLATMTILLLLPATLAHHIVTRNRPLALGEKSFWIAFVSSVVLAVVLTLPWINEMIKARRLHNYEPIVLEGISNLVATWSRLVSPPQYHPIWGPLIYQLDGEGISRYNEYTYLGIVAFLIATLGLVFSPARRPMIVWVAAFLIALGLAGGNGKSINHEWAGTPLAFSKFWPEVFPFVEFRVPSRWQFALCTVLAVWLAIASSQLFQRCKTRSGRSLAFASVTVLLLLDLARLPLPVSSSQPQPSALGGISAGAVLDIPVGVTSGQGVNFGHYNDGALLRQMSHHRPVLSATVSRLPVDVVDKLKADREFLALIALQDADKSTSIPADLDWAGFQQRYDISAIRIPVDFPTSSTLFAIARNINPHWQWRETDTELIGR